MTDAPVNLLLLEDSATDAELLGRQGLVDKRLNFLSYSRIGAGASRARNLALDRIAIPHGAIRDAYDRMKPKKM